MISNIEKKHTVLIVDDEEINLLMLGNIVASEYNVLYAHNGKDALEVLQNKHEEISLVLLDYLMPEMNGIEFLKIIKQDDKFKNIPIIILTTEASVELEFIKAGAMDFIEKPFSDPNVVLARIERIIEAFEDRQLIVKVEYDETNLLTKDFYLEYLSRLDFENGEDLVVACIDNLLLLTEIYGHEEIDKLLKITADVIKGFLKNHPGLACHLGGEYFSFCCTPLEDINDLLKIEEAINNLFYTTVIRMRFGILRGEGALEDVAKRVDSAIFACDTLKTNFNTQIAFYDQKLHDDEALTFRLLEDVDKGIEDKEFKVYMQPKFDIRDNKPLLVGAESLVRWVHHDLGMVPPFRFIPLFEKNGLVKKIDLYVFEETARIIAGWKENYHVSVPVSVNISRIDLYDEELLDKLKAILDKYNLTIDDINIEVTEGVYMESDNVIVKRIENLRKAGFKIEMDDFGAGYSSLNMLHSLPIDTLKLDKEFAQTIEDDKQYHIIKCIVDFSKHLGVKTISEGVENREQYESIKKAGVDIVQGYYFCKPLPEEEFVKYIKELGERKC